jgi:hypothetical protein
VPFLRLARAGMASYAVTLTADSQRTWGTVLPIDIHRPVDIDVQLNLNARIAPDTAPRLAALRLA